MGFEVAPRVIQQHSLWHAKAKNIYQVLTYLDLELKPPGYYTSALLLSIYVVMRYILSLERCSLKEAISNLFLLYRSSTLKSCSTE